VTELATSIICSMHILWKTEALQTGRNKGRRLAA